MKLSKIFSAAAVLLTLFVGIGFSQLANDWKPTTGQTWTAPSNGQSYTMLYSPSSVRRVGAVVSSDVETVFADSSLNVFYAMQYNCTTHQYTYAGYDLSVTPPVLGVVSEWKDVVPNTAGASVLPFFCRYRETAAQVTPGLKLVANLDYHNGFTVDAPLTMTTDGPKAGTTTAGVAYTQTIYGAAQPNDDNYMVGVSEYPFQVEYADLDRGIEGFRAALDGTVTKTDTTTVSGNPAKMAIVDAVRNGRTIRFAILITYRGNKAFIFAFGTWMDTQGTNMDEVKTFFTSARLN